MSKIPWYKDSVMEFVLEAYEDEVFLHFGITHWSKQIHKGVTSILHEIEDEMGIVGYRHLWLYNPEQTASWDKLVTKVAKYPILVYMPNGHHIYGKELICH